MKNYWIDFIDSFLFEKEVNEWVCKGTIKIYNTMFNVLCDNKFVKINDPNTFTEINFKRLLWDRLTKYNWSSHTYNKYRKNFKVFCGFLVREGYIKENPLNDIKLRKAEKLLPKYLNTKQIIQIKNVINNTFSDDDFLTIRNKTILFFYMYTWVRLYELINLNFEDIDFINNTIKINKWKGWKDRLVPMIYKLSDLLIFYLLKKKSAKINSNILFPTRFCWNMQHRDIYNLLNKIKTKIDFKITPHMFRHTFATELVRKNINIYNVSRVLWHSNLKTTQIYLGLDVNSVNISLNNANLFC